MGNSGSKNTQSEENGWIVKNFETQNDVLKQLPDIKIATYFKNTENVIKVKIRVTGNFEELNQTNLKILQQIIIKNSIIIFISSNGVKKFNIYWKSKDIRQLLSLKPIHNSFSEYDKHLCEQVADFLAESLQNGHLGVHPDKNIWFYQGKIDLYSLIDSREYNLLLLASEAGNVKPIEALLKYGIFTQLKNSEITAQRLAWQGHHSGVLLKFMEANFPFPPQIDINKCSEELKSFIRTSEVFHKMIIARNKNRLEEIIKRNPNLRYFYNISNKSALKTALDYKLIDMYEFLISKNLSFAPHEDTDAIWDGFETTEKKKIHSLNLKYFNDIPEKHINILTFNTSIISDKPDEDAEWKLVLRAYRVLNIDSRLKIILKIVASSKAFHIFFDFRNTKQQESCYYERIYIDAQQLYNSDTEHETLALLIHQLCSYALVIVYKNNASPYTSTDEQAEEEFAKICELCKERMEEESLIQSVFDYYPAKYQPSELIVCVPHLIALYSHQPEILKEVIVIFNVLFNHYTNVIVPAMERALIKIEDRLANRHTYVFGELSDQNKEKVKNGVINYKNVEIKLSELFPGNSDVFKKLISDHISQLLKNEELDFDDPDLKYLEGQISLKWESLAEKLKRKFLSSNFNFQGKIIKYSDLSLMKTAVFNSLTSNQINQVLSGTELDIGKNIELSSEFYVDRKFILEDAGLLYFEYIYGHEFKFTNIQTMNDHILRRKSKFSFDHFILEFMKKDFGERSNYLYKVKQNDYYNTIYIDNTQPNFSFMYKNSTEIIEKVCKEKILILSSEAGAGKTVTFEWLAIKMKMKFETRWVSYIDFKNYVKLYKSKDFPENVDELLGDILCSNLIKNEFEKTIFLNLFKSGQVVLVWNGFDEISPIYNEFVLNLIKFIHNNTTNIQLVCTRTLYSDQLSTTFKICSWQLLPFNEGDKKEFIEKYFDSVNIPKTDKGMQKVQNTIDGFKCKNDLKDNFSTPLMLKFVIEISEDEELSDCSNLYQICEAFIVKKVEVWIERLNQAQSVAKKLIFSGYMKGIYHKYALLSQLKILSRTTLGLKMRKLQVMLTKAPSDMPYEEISRIAVLYINDENEFEFANDIFSQFFVAQYFIENIFYSDDLITDEEAELRLELFFYLMKRYEDGQRRITDFIGSYLSGCNKNEDTEFGEKISQLLKTKFKYFFFKMLDANDPDVYSVLFKFFSKDYKLFIHMLHIDEDETLYTAIFNPNYFGFSVNPETILYLAKIYLVGEHLKKLFYGKNQKGKIIYGMNFYKRIGVDKIHRAYKPEARALENISFWEFFYKIKGQLTEEEQKELFKTALSPKIFLYYNKIFNANDLYGYENFWKKFESLLTTDEMLEAIGNALVFYIEIDPIDKRESEIFLSFLSKKADLFLEKPQIYQMLLNLDIFNKAFKNLQTFIFFWKHFSKFLNQEQKKAILGKINSDDNINLYTLKRCDRMKHCSNHEYNYSYYDCTPFSIFDRALIYARIKFISDEICCNYFSNAEFQKMIFRSNNFLFYAIQKSSKGGCFETAAFLRKIFNRNPSALKELLERKIKPTRLTVFDYVKSYKKISASEAEWFIKIDILEQLYYTIYHLTN